MQPINQQFLRSYGEQEEQEQENQTVRGLIHAVVAIMMMCSQTTVVGKALNTFPAELDQQLILMVVMCDYIAAIIVMRIR